MSKNSIFNGSDALVATLADLGLRCVFGVPGSQNIGVLESLRSSEIRTVLATNETAAGFMANGWFRASGQPGVFLAIAGSGFAWTVPPLAEAALDSAATLLITGKPPDRGYKHDLHAVNQQGIATALECPVFDINDSQTLVETVRAAWLATTQNGPRPVVLQVSSAVLAEDWVYGTVGAAKSDAQPNAGIPSDELIACLAQATRPVIFAGAGTLAYADKLERFVDYTGAAFFTTPTARGVIRESHPMCLGTDFLCDGVDDLNTFLESSDLIIALGCRLSHNGTGGFGLELTEDKLSHVDLDYDVLQSNYPARWPLHMDVGDSLDALLENLPSGSSGSQRNWGESEIRHWREKLRAKRKPIPGEPSWKEHGDCRGLFGHIRDGTPDDGIIVTDTGLHQILARTYIDILGPGGLIFPSDLQSVGFGLPAAIGAALSVPERAVVALIGDGSLLSVGAELLTAKREGLSLPVLIFCDGYLGQCRQLQIENFGYEFTTRLEPVDLAAYSASLGVEHRLAGVDLAEQLRSSFNRGRPTVIEVRLEDSGSLDGIRQKARTKNKLKAAIGPGATRLIKRLAR